MGSTNHVLATLTSPGGVCGDYPQGSVGGPVSHTCRENKRPVDPPTWCHYLVGLSPPLACRLYVIECQPRHPPVGHNAMEKIIREIIPENPAHRRVYLIKGRCQFLLGECQCIKCRQYLISISRTQWGPSISHSPHHVPHGVDKQSIHILHNHCDYWGCSKPDDSQLEIYAHTTPPKLNDQHIHPSVDIWEY